MEGRIGAFAIGVIFGVLLCTSILLSSFDLKDHVAAPVGTVQKCNWDSHLQDGVPIISVCCGGSAKETTFDIDPCDGYAATVSYEGVMNMDDSRILVVFVKE